MFFSSIQKRLQERFLEEKRKKNSQNDCSLIENLVFKSKTEQLSKVFMEIVFRANVKITGRGWKVEMSHELVKST